jgi:hypothetical protein
MILRFIVIFYYWVEKHMKVIIGIEAERHSRYASYFNYNSCCLGTGQQRFYWSLFSFYAFKKGLIRPDDNRVLIMCKLQ